MVLRREGEKVTERMNVVRGVESKRKIRTIANCSISLYIQFAFTSLSSTHVPSIPLVDPSFHPMHSNPSLASLGAQGPKGGPSFLHCTHCAGERQVVCAVLC